MQRVQEWRNALTAAADLVGHDIRGKIESDCIRRIVAEVSSKLCKTSVSYLKNIVGIDTHLEKVKFLLKMEINDIVRIVGIWGMGGIGKTTIARAVFDILSSQFEAACFIADIKEKEKSKLHDLQNVLLFELLRDKDVQVNNKEDGKHMIARRLRFKKVLVVLDDIDHKDHLDYLAGDLSWYGNGSRIIVTTRDRHLIKWMIDVVYEVTTLPDNDAIKLFNKYAFREEVPDECFEKLSLEVVSHANGLPLALKVWGSFLHKRNITEWRSAIEQMRINSNSEIVEKLKISYDGLERIQQDIFLDIACFLRGGDKALTMPILESCFPGVVEIELSVLIDKSLVFISDCDKIEMHDLIQDMGKYVVKMQKDSGGLTRIWNTEDFKEVMLNNTESMAVEAIWLRVLLLRVQLELSFNKEALKNMTRLRILNIYIESSSSNCHDESIQNLSNNLRWFVWKHYPWNSLPENFKPQRLVLVHLPFSSLHHLWNQTKVQLPCLQKLSLYGSERLIETPDFTGMPNLEDLYLSNCGSLKEVHPSLRCCRKLKRLDLSNCKSLVRFPCFNVESLEFLDLEYCSSLEKFPEIFGMMKPELKTEIGGSGIREIPSSFFQHQTHLTELHFKDLFGYKKHCYQLVSLPSSICMLKGLVTLDVSRCKGLESLPVEIGDLENLEKLYARNTLISELPSSIVRLNKLKVLDFAKRCDSEEEYSSENPDSEEEHYSENYDSEEEHYSENSDSEEEHYSENSDPEEEHYLENYDLEEEHYAENYDSEEEYYLEISDSEEEHYDSGIEHYSENSDSKYFVFPQLNGGLCSLEILNLRFCNLNDRGLPEDIGCLSSLKELNLSRNDFEHLPQSIGELGALRSLDLSHCRWLKKLPGFMRMPNLEELNLRNCNLMDGRLLKSVGCFSSLNELNLSKNDFKHLPQSIGELGALRSLVLSHCKRLKELPDFMRMQNLEELDLSNCNLIDGRLLESAGCFSLGALRSLDLSRCKGLKVLPRSMRMPNLEKLNISYCNLIDGGLPEDIGSLSSLKELYLRGNDFEHLPQSIAQLGALRFLNLEDCKRLKVLPEFPPQLKEIDADWDNDWMCNSLFQNISSLQHDISASDSLSIRVFSSWICNYDRVPSWFQFHHEGSGTSVSVNLAENWYINDTFLGFAVCYRGFSTDITAHLISLCDDGISLTTQKLAVRNHLENAVSGLYFFLVPLSCLWDTSKTNGKTPNDYGCIKFSFSGEMEEFGFRLLYKDEAAEHCIGTKRSRDEDSEHHDEASSFPCNDEPTEDHDEAVSSTCNDEPTEDHDEAVFFSCNDEPTENHDEAVSSSCNDEPTEHCMGIRWSTSWCRIL